MKITVGSPATDTNYFPRSIISDKLMQVLPNEHVLFLAPRRTGKTSVLLHIQKTAPVNAVFINLENINTPSDWIKKMRHEVSEIKGGVSALLHQAKEFLPRIKNKTWEITEKNWQQQGDDLIASLESLQTPLWFLLDEFPIMIDLIAKKQGVQEAEAAVHWLRHLRQENSNSSTRFLLTGSIGLDSVLRRHGIRGATNDIRRITLLPLTAEEALELCLKLANDNAITLTSDNAKDFIQRLGQARWPYFLQLFIAELEDLQNSSNPVVNIDTLYRAASRNQYSDNMWDRLKDIFTEPEALTARQLLKLLAATDSGIAMGQLRSQAPQLEQTDFDYVLEVLQHDGYLCETEDGRFEFFSFLLRDYWRNRTRS